MRRKIQNMKIALQNSGVEIEEMNSLVWTDAGERVGWIKSARRFVRSWSRDPPKSGPTRDQTYENYYTLSPLYSPPGFKKGV